jgi:hypothetical protein
MICRERRSWPPAPARPTLFDVAVHGSVLAELAGCNKDGRGVRGRKPETRGIRINGRVMLRAVLLAVLLGAGFAVVPLAAADERRIETEHLIIDWKEDAASKAVLDMARDRGETSYAALREMLGHEPKAKIVISLEGSAQRPDGSWGYPRVDGWGRILLYQYTEEPESTFNALAHEMVHVFRLQPTPHHDWFLEEGFAEFVARRVDPSPDGFPWYGFPVDVVAGQWIARGEGIPLAVLRESHRDLNLQCKAQSYSLRSSFFLYLGDTHGDTAVLKMANREQAGAPDDYPLFFEHSFDTLVVAWQEALMKSYESIENVDDLAKRYRESPVQYMQVCWKGREFP